MNMQDKLKLAGLIVLGIISLGILTTLNVLWIMGINGEVRTTALTLDVAFLTLFLNWMRKLGGTNG